MITRISDRYAEPLLIHILSRTQTWNLTNYYQRPILKGYMELLLENGCNIYDGFRYLETEVRTHNWKDQQDIRLWFIDYQRSLE